MHKVDKSCQLCSQRANSFSGPSPLTLITLIKVSTIPQSSQQFLSHSDHSTNLLSVSLCGVHMEVHRTLLRTRYFATCDSCDLKCLEPIPPTSLGPRTLKTLSSSQFISVHLISSHFVSFHLKSSQFISYHLISSQFISYHLISSQFISVHLSSSQFISCHLMSSRFISFHLVSSRLISLHPISSQLISFHFISSHLISCRLISSRFI